MNDLIERNAALNAINVGGTLEGAFRKVTELPSAQLGVDEWCTDCKEYDQKQHCCHRWTKVIRNTVEEIKAYQQWIPVSERLPENSDFYIVTSKDFLVRRTWFSVIHGWEWQEEPIAWMPLPEPWKGEER